jgi:hypothetical protein
MNLRSIALVTSLLVLSIEAFFVSERRSTGSPTNNDAQIVAFSSRHAPQHHHVHPTDHDKAETSESTRRRVLLLQKFPLAFTTAGLSTAAVTLWSTAPPAWAADSSQSALFQPNPLTNGFLEQIRIWEQAEADNLKYGGELARGDAGNKGQVSAYPKLLVPILVVARELGTVARAVQTGGPTQYAEALQILRQSKYDKVEFKRVFNAFADNIYYADPDRANLYLAGGGACLHAMMI